MSRHIPNVLPLTLLSLLLVTTIACSPGSPEEQIAKIRAEYTVELNSWSAQEPEVEAPVGETASEAEAVAAATEVAAEAEEGAGEGEVDEEEMSGPQPKNVIFDLIVYFKGRKSLPGVTVDVTHADSGQQEKATYKQWIDTAGIINGETRQLDFVLEGLEVEDGDAFAVTLASGVPADLNQYREFSEPAP